MAQPHTRLTNGPIRYSRIDFYCTPCSTASPAAERLKTPVGAIRGVFPTSLALACN